MLIDKKAELGRTITELEKQRAALPASMRAQNLSDEQEQTLIDFANADASFKTRRGIIEALGAEVIRSQEEGTKTLRIKCILGEDYYVIGPILFEHMSDDTL